jgi:hypothetical protein
MSSEPPATDISRPPPLSPPQAASLSLSLGRCSLCLQSNLLCNSDGQICSNCQRNNLHCHGLSNHESDCQSGGSSTIAYLPTHTDYYSGAPGYSYSAHKSYGQLQPVASPRPHHNPYNDYPGDNYYVPQDFINAPPGINLEQASAIPAAVYSSLSIGRQYDYGTQFHRHQ